MVYFLTVFAIKAGSLLNRGQKSGKKTGNWCHSWHYGYYSLTFPVPDLTSQPAEKRL